MVSLVDTEWTGMITPPRPPGPYGGGPFGIKVRFLADGSVWWMVQMQPNRKWQTDSSVQWLVDILPHMKWGEWNKSWRWKQTGDEVEFGHEGPPPREISVGALRGSTISGTNRYESADGHAVDVNQLNLQLTGSI